MNSQEPKKPEKTRRIIPIQCFKTSAYQCSYLTNQLARSEVVSSPTPLPWDAFSQLIQNGFRRSGFYVYRPHCDLCQACIPVRIDVNQFKANRNQRRVDKKYRDVLNHIFLPCDFYEDHYQLYSTYQRVRHTDGPMDKDDVNLYFELLESDFTETFLLEFRDQSGMLKIVSLIDLVDDGISAVYTFYDTEHTQDSYGTFGVLTLVRLAKQMGLSYVYLGYWIEHCHKMQYKRQFSGLQKLVKNHWVDLQEDGSIF